MSGNLWKFSDQLDDEDIEMLQHDFITYYQGVDYYRLGLKIFTRMAHEAGAVYKIGRMVRVRRDIFEEYLRQQHSENNSEAKSMMEEDETMKQGVLVEDPDTGRMDIRFELDDYYGGLHCGTTMDVLIHGEWIPTRIEMGKDWYLVGIKAERLPGLAVRI